MSASGGPRPSDPTVPTATVDRVGLITVDQFEAHVRPGGTPVLIDGWTADWRALSAWSPEFFRDRYGDDDVTFAVDGKDRKTTASLAEYVDYLLGLDEDSRLMQLHREAGRSAPFYCLSYKPFVAHPELLDDFALPPFVADWWPYFNESFRRAHFPQRQGWIFIAGAGASAPLHRDSHHTITWLAQVRGRKMYRLYDPADSEAIDHGAIDPVAVDPDRHPSAFGSTQYVCVLEPGQMLFLPPNWYHHSVSLDDSITISYNLVNHLNLGPYLLEAYGTALPQILLKLPAVPGVEDS